MKLVIASLVLCLGLCALLVIPRVPPPHDPDPLAGKPWKSWRPGSVPQGDGPGKKPDDWFTRQRAYPGETIPEPARLRGLNEARIQRTLGALSSNTIGLGAWVPAGPTNVHGRITSIDAHPSFPNTVYIGTADGGVFKSLDGGDNWTPIFDHAPSLAIGALAVSPSDVNTVYVGTGEANAAGDTYAGDGVWKTSDGGATWDHLGLAATAKIGRILVDPANPNRIFVAAMGRLFGTNPERGLYRSLDAGNNWSQVLFLNDSTGVIDVVMHPDSTDHLYAASWERVRRPTHRQVGGLSSRIHKSTDGGDSWTLLGPGEGLPTPGVNNGRIGLALAASQPSTVFAYFIDHPGNFMGIYRTVDSGANWTRVDDGSSINNVTSTFGWYFGQIRVDPTNPDRVFVMGVPVYRSTNGGTDWSSVGDGMHVDHHAMWIDPGDPNHIYAGNDGGFYESTNGGTSWTKKGELPITQFYAITVDEQLPHRLYGGTQDNSTNRTKTGGTSGWDVIYGGDGFYTLVDPTNSKVIYAEYQFGGLSKSTNTGASWTSVLTGIPGGDRRNWSTPVVMDPGDPEVLYYGTYRLFRTTDGASNWSAISSDLTSGLHPGNLGLGTITTIDVATTDPASIMVGTDDGNVWITTNLGGNWTKVSGSFPDRWVTRVAFDPTNASTAYVTLSGYRLDEYLPHIFATVDAGANWTDISTNLPGIPLNDVIVDPEDPDILYVAADAGVYWSVNKGASWQVLGSGLPNSAVLDLHLHNGTRKLVAGTHGRSMFTYSLGDVVGVTDADPRTPPARVSVFPNPMQRSATLALSVEQSERLRVGIYDIQGRLVRELADRPFTPGEHRMIWNGLHDDGRRVATGTYFYRVTGAERPLAGKIVVAG